MLFPKGKGVYENLNTSFAQLDALLADLKTNQFTGYVQLIAWEYEGVLVLDTGNVVHAIEETNGQIQTGPAAAETIVTKASEKDGTLNVYRLSEEVASLLAGVYKSEPLYRDLASDFTSLAKLISKLQSEKHTGYVQVRRVDDKEVGTVFIKDGQTVEAVISTNGTVSSGLQVLDQIMQTAAKHPSLFTVFRSDLAQAYGEQLNLANSFARREMLSFWQELFKAVDASLEQPARRELFFNTLDRVRIEHAHEFPFLDPFAAEFEFSDGRVQFTGQAPAAQFNQGLGQCLVETLGQFSAQPGSKELLKKLQPALADLKSRYGPYLQTSGLAAALPELFGQ